MNFEYKGLGIKFIIYESHFDEQNIQFNNGSAILNNFILTSFFFVLYILIMSLKDFEILSLLGQGSYASVHKVRRIADQQIYALKRVKMLNLTDKQQSNALNEIRILASIKHPNIISYKDCFLEKATKQLCLVTELADEGDLEQRINYNKQQQSKFSEEQIWNVFIQVSKGLKALHLANILHRDLKSANVFLFKDKKVKIGDMNVSKILKGHLCLTQTGTPYYASPQIWKQAPYNHKSDVWSLGCIIYEMATLSPPFKAKSMEGLFKKVVKGIYPKISDNYSSNLKTIIRMMLQVSIEQRPSVGTLLLSDFISKKQYKENEEDVDENNIELLQTIKLSKKNHYLNINLPKAQYQNSMKNKKSMRLLPSIDRHRKINNSAKHININQQRTLPLLERKRYISGIKSAKCIGLLQKI